MIGQLQPWHANVAKRQVKAPKIYLRDTGVLHALLGIDDMRSLDAHPKSGASWEGFMLESVVDRLGLPDEDLHFWATHSGAELDLVVGRGQRRIGVEIKRTTMPKVTRSMRTTMHDLDLQEVIVVHAGKDSYPLGSRIRAVAGSRLDRDLGLGRWPRL